jgi:pSer/pThr/pTyr-binding forkhead associated (FHA) protein
MNGTLNRRELMMKALAGLAGGALGWLPVELATNGHSLTEAPTEANLIFTYIAMCVLSGLIGGFIVAAEGQQIELTPETRNRFLRGFFICALIAVFSNYISNRIFGAIITSGGWSVNHEGSMAFLVIGRITSWIVMGGLLGAGVGIATFSIPNIGKGGLGGVIGGFIGGALFDLINYASGGGLPARLIGLSLIGLAIGLLIGLVQELTKSAWIVVEKGRLRGRQFRIEGARASIGRAEENPIGLFGDQSVQPRHAIIERSGKDYILKNLAVDAGTTVNGSRIESVALHEGDRINIGGYEMVFHLRQAAGQARGSLATRAPSPTPAAAAAPAAAAPAASVVNGAPAGGPYLIDSNGQRHALKRDASTTLGRALDNDIVVNDSSVSRHHAAIESQYGSTKVRDLSSQNGTFVSERRVTEAYLSDGDSVRLGDAPFTFRA